MRAVSWGIAFLAALAVCGGPGILGVERAEALTYTTITFDGIIEYDPPVEGGTTWETDEQMEGVGDTYFHLTWDETNLYIAFTSTDTGQGDVCVALDILEGGTTDPMWGARFDAGYAPEYFIGVAHAGYMEYRFGDETGWQAPQDVTGDPDWALFAGWSGQPDTEIQIPLAWLGTPETIGVMAWTVSDDHADVWTAFPTAAVGGPDPEEEAPITFAQSYGFSGLGTAVAPKTGWHSSRFVLTLGADYHEGALNLDYAVGCPEPATWANYLILTVPDVRVIPLWTVPLPVLDPPLKLSELSFPLPPIGLIGLWSGLFTAAGAETVILEWVDTDGEPLDFNGTYLVTLSYEDGAETSVSLTLSQNGEDVFGEMDMAHLSQILTGLGTVDGDLITIELTDYAAVAEPTSLTFNGRGIDLDSDGMVDVLTGSFDGTECTDTCEEVVGDFDSV